VLTYLTEDQESKTKDQQTINAFPLVLADRLWVKSLLKSEEEKLRVSA
jgi:hypothetical protein